MLAFSAVVAFPGAQAERLLQQLHIKIRGQRGLRLRGRLRVDRRRGFVFYHWRKLLREPLPLSASSRAFLAMSV